MYSAHTGVDVVRPLRWPLLDVVRPRTWWIEYFLRSPRMSWSFVNFDSLSRMLLITKAVSRELVPILHILIAKLGLYFCMVTFAFLPWKTIERRLLKLGRMYFGLRLDEVIKFIFLFSVKKGTGFQSSPEINISFYVKFWCEMRGGGEDNAAFPFSFGKCFWVSKKVFLWSSAACWYAVIELWFYPEVESIWFLDKHFQKKSALAEATVSVKARAGRRRDGPAARAHLAVRRMRRGLCWVRLGAAALPRSARVLAYYRGGFLLSFT